MKTNLYAGHKWWKIGAATFLSIGLLAACGDDSDDNDMNGPAEEDVDVNVENDDEAEDPNNTEEVEDEDKE